MCTGGLASGARVVELGFAKSKCDVAVVEILGGSTCETTARVVAEKVFRLQLGLSCSLILL